MSSAISNSTSTTASSATVSETDNSRTILSDNFDSFLMLLTTQLQNQDPLSPMETHQFTNQLVMFAEAEQAIATNKKLDTLIGINQNNEASQALSYHGKQVRVKGNELSFLGEPVRFQYTMDQDASSGELIVRDVEGKEVLTRQLSAGQIQEGDHEMAWDGRNNFGYVLANGLYNVSIVAKDASGETIEAKNFTTTASVRGVEYEDGQTWLDVGYMKVTLDNVTSITSPAFDVNDQARALGFVGQNVHITGANAPIKDGKLSLTYNTAGTQSFREAIEQEEIKKVELKFLDDAGATLKTSDITSFMDQAKLAPGEKRMDIVIPDLPDGDYQVRMDVAFHDQEIVDENGTSSTLLGSTFNDIPLGYSGKVRRVVFENGEIRLEINSVLYNPSDVGAVVSADTPIFTLSGL